MWNKKRPTDNVLSAGRLVRFTGNDNRDVDDDHASEEVPDNNTAASNIDSLEANNTPGDSSIPDGWEWLLR